MPGLLGEFVDSLHRGIPVALSLLRLRAAVRHPVQNV